MAIIYDNGDGGLWTAAASVATLFVIATSAGTALMSSSTALGIATALEVTATSAASAVATSSAMASASKATTLVLVSVPGGDIGAGCGSR